MNDRPYPERLYVHNARVIRVVDGDTVDLSIDLGWGHHKEDRIRLFGINAPEKRGAEKEAGMAASAELKRILPYQTDVRIESLGLEDAFGRSISTIYRRDDRLNVNRYMVEVGHAVEKDY